MRGRLTLALLASCGHPTTPSTVTSTPHTVAVTPPAAKPEVPDEDPPPGVPKIPYVTWSKATVDFGETSPRPTVVRSVTLPGDVSTVQWAGTDPVALLADGTVGKLGTAWTPYPSLKPTTFAIAQPANTEKIDPPWWALAVTATNEVWQGRCDWGVPYDGIGCTEWVYARRDPAPLKLIHAAPKLATIALLEAPPSTTIKLEVADKVVHCLNGAASADLPTDGAPWGKVHGVRWLRSDPPMYLVDHTQLGMMEFDMSEIFEGCERAMRYQGAQIVAGPDGAFAIEVPDKPIEIWWKGHHLGDLAGKAGIAFGAVK